jgi:CspA family cold shock protein
MADHGTVRVWHDDEGWGVVDSTATPGGCWTHFSSAAVPGYAAFTAGQAVWLDSEAADQDGYGFRAVRVWRQDTEPVERPNADPDGAYGSVLTLTFDDPST